MGIRISSREPLYGTTIFMLALSHRMTDARPPSWCARELPRRGIFSRARCCGPRGPIILWGFLTGLLPILMAMLTLMASDRAFALQFGTDSSPPAATPGEPSEKPTMDLPGLIRLSPQHDVWMDPRRKLVVVDGMIALRKGTLEMFACPRGTKEHESIVAVLAPPSTVHAGLLAVGAKTGMPARFQPEYAPPTGTEVDIFVLWKDREGKPQKARAQEWVRQTRTGKELAYPWVFVGSSFWEDESTGRRHYNADGGDFICVSNFSTATLDLPVESSPSDDDLLYEAFTERIPTVGTRVRLVLVPRLDRSPPSP